MIKIDNKYKTVKDCANAEIVEKRSRFIAYVRPVDTEDGALEYLNYIKQKHRDARHNVYAYIIRENNIMRYSDDGEPGGTAGMPVLDMIKKEGLCDIIIVVTRYFGGVLLGTGGLVRAYSTAVVNGLKSAEVVTMCESVRCRIVCPYDKYGALQKLLENFSVKRIDTEFSENIVLTFGIKSEEFRQFDLKVKDAFCGKLSIKTESEYFDSY